MADTYFLLPATDPRDSAYGLAPSEVAGPNGPPVHKIQFDREVWYNADVRREVRRQVLQSGVRGRRIGVGFSKSGLGVLGVSLEYPDTFDAILVYDAPLTLRVLPPWNTGSFYTQETWERDLPICNLQRIRDLLGKVRLVHVAGKTFWQQHDEFHLALSVNDPNYAYHRECSMEHHWSSGWLAKYHSEVAVTLG